MGTSPCDSLYCSLQIINSTVYFTELLVLLSASSCLLHAGMSAGKGYVDVSTIDPETSKKVAAAVRAKGCLFLEAPVSGSKGPAEQGALIFLTAGMSSLFCMCVCVCGGGGGCTGVCY